jgi:hypothetical protein
MSSESNMVWGVAGGMFRKHFIVSICEQIFFLKINKFEMYLYQLPRLLV